MRTKWQDPAQDIYAAGPCRLPWAREREMRFRVLILLLGLALALAAWWGLRALELRRLQPSCARLRKNSARGGLARHALGWPGWREAGPVWARSSTGLALVKWSRAMTKPRWRRGAAYPTMPRRPPWPRSRAAGSPSRQAAIVSPRPLWCRPARSEPKSASRRRACWDGSTS